MSNSDPNEPRLRRAIAAVLELQRRNAELEAKDGEAVAIIGMACRFPGGLDSPEAYWDVLRDGADVIGPFPERWASLDVFDADPDAPGKTYAREGGFIRDIERFDAGFFGISPREALAMDPQQRLVLETSWEALERAGLPPTSLEGTRTGVYLGALSSDYGAARGGGLEALDGYQGTGNQISVVSGRVAYVLGLNGPAVTVDTACSSSLVALHFACTALRRGECDAAVAGGVTVMSTPAQFIEFSRLKGMAPDGRCKSFSAGADGTGWAEGCGVLVLKLLSAAQRDGDRILAVVRGSALNQDGKSHGLTAPNGPAQQRVVRDALEASQLSPSDIDAIEAHGTGTALGDPIEAEALAAVFGGDPTRRVYLGSSKSNLGHTQAAAGVAGVIKMVLALQHELLPRTLHAEKPTPHADWDTSVLSLLDTARPWPRGPRPRRAGISSFGFSGTNAHLIVEEAPSPSPASPEARAAAAAPFTPPLLLSARDEQGLKASAARFTTWLEGHAEVDPAALAHTMARHRAHLEVRAAVRGESVAELSSALSALAAGDADARVLAGEAKPGRVAVVFTGQGSQRAGMGRKLHDALPAFRSAFDEVARAIGAYLPRPLHTIVFAEPGSPEAALLDQTEYTQPALFAVEVALFRQWQAWGLEIAAVAGHSVGELAAAHVAGILGLDDAAKLVVMRARLMQGCETGGAMASIEATEAEVADALAAAGAQNGARLAIAGVNGRRQIVVSGDGEQVSAIVRGFAARGRRTKALNVSHAFHSPHMDGMIAELQQVASGCTFAPPSIRFVTTGGAGDPTTPRYWALQVRNPVRFADAVERLHGDGVVHFLECGPGGALAAMAADSIPAGGAGTCIASSAKGEDELSSLVGAMSRLHVAGVSLDWRAIFGDCPTVPSLDLPTYPFGGDRFWPAAPKPATDARSVGLETFDHAWGGVVTSLAGGGSLLAGRFDLGKNPWLRDHAVFGTVVVPGTGLLEMALAAAEHAGARRVAELTLLEPLILTDAEPRRFQIELGVPDENGRRSLSISTQAESAEDGSWTCHAEGELADEPDVQPKAEELQTWPPAGAERLALDGFYERLRATGLEYGPTFQGLCEAYRVEDRLFARVALPKDAAQGFLLHPALCDAALHVLAAASSGPVTAHVPFAWSDIALITAGSTELRVCIEHEQDGEGARARVLLADARGRFVGRIGGLDLRPISAAQLAAAGSQQEPLFRVEFTPWQPAPPATETGAAADPFVIRRGVATAGDLFTRLDGGASAPTRILVDATDERTGADAATLATEAISEALVTLQRCLGDDRLANSELVWITNGALAAGGAEIDLVRAPIAGLLRSARAEHAMRVVRLIDVDGDAALGTELFARVLADPSEPEVAIRTEAALVPRLARASVAAEAPRFRKGGRVLITGGTGHLGRSLANHLVREHGVRHLVLTSRRGLEAPGARELAAELEAAGATSVAIVACDVSRRDDVEKLVATESAEQPWCAVVHLAGVLDDGALEEQTSERFERVMAPKAAGAMHLHELFAARELDAFVLFSSAAGTFGGAGQSNYAAANAFLDALATARRAEGLPATSLAWGLWLQDGRGMTGHLGAADLARARRLGAVPLSMKEGMRLFDRALASREAVLVPAKLDLTPYRHRARVDGNVPPIFRGLVRSRIRRAGGKASLSETNGLRERILSLPEAERLGAVTGMVRAEVAAILGLGIDKISATKPFRDLGFDSLTAVELRTRLSARWRMALPAALAFAHPSSEEVAQLVVAQLPNAEVHRAVRPVLGRATGERVHPATEGQQRLWFLEQLEPGTAQYHLANKLRIDAPLDFAAFERALELLFQRHEALRSTLELRDGKLVQVVLTDPGVKATREEITPATGDVEQELARRIRAEEVEPFAWNGSVPVRCRIFDLAEDRHVLCLTFHHALIDGWTVTMLLDELFHAYQAFARGESFDRVLPRHQLGDYARWEAKCLAENRFEDGLRYFAKELAGMPRLELPAPSEDAAAEASGGDTVFFTLPPAVRGRIEALASRTGVTPFVVLVTAYAALLARYTGQRDFGMGTVLANRELGDVAATAGFFANTLALRCDLAEDPSFEAALVRVQKQVLGLLEHQHVPLTEVIRACGLPRKDDENPLFRATFIYENGPIFARVRGEGDWERWEPSSHVANVRGASKFELGLVLCPVDGALVGELEYRPTVMHRAMAERFARNFERLVSSAVDDASQPLSRLDILDADEAGWLESKRGSVAPPGDGASACELVLAQARRTPDACAITCNGAELTYRDVARRAQTLAEKLSALGVESGDLVGIYLPRSELLPVSLLGTWMAGATYVPLDPGYPAARVTEITADAGLRAIITTRSLASEAIAVGTQLLVVDDVDFSEADGDLPPAPPLDPSAVAYVIYTSGSTGKPKGVMIEHRQLANFCRAMDRVVGGGVGDTWLAVTSASFDISGLELVWTLTRGYTVAVAQGIVDATAPRAARPTHLQCTPSMAKLFLADADGRALLSGIRHLLIGGEALDRPLAAKLQTVIKGRISNMYGPTETTIWSSTWDVNAGPVSIGDPVLNNTFYVLDESGNEVPRGIAGELFIGGLGVARGYLNRPELTSARFVADPRGGPGARMYRTGDLVRYREDGTLEFRGRIDSQIKLRGHRIELGEIEAVASESSLVRTCAAIVREDRPGDPQLVLYWVRVAGAASGAADLENWLASRLPAYMVPSRFVELAELPHTPAKKVDRVALRRLPAQEESVVAPGRPAQATSHSYEELVAAAWRATLGLADVDWDRGFFDLGATSMTSLAAHRAISTAIGRDFPLAALFRYPTVRKLAAFLGGGPSRTSSAVALRSVQGEEAIAIVGFAVRLPASPNVDAYWDNLDKRVDCITRFSVDELRAAGVPESLLADPDYVRAKGYIEGADLFDAGFFEYSRSEAESIDPQHRLFLECAWEALEHAGVVPARFGGRIGIFGGAGIGGYDSGAPEDLADFYRLLLGSKNDYLATRVAHKLDLRGPALTIQTACSTSLVATHLARESLLRGESDIALAGGASVSVPLKHGYKYQQGLIVSPDGVCRAFDEKAAGTTLSNGAGVVVLRRLSDALEAGDTIYAVLRGTAINNDGSDKVGFSAPSVDGQAAVIEAAHAAAGVTAETIGLVEAHGTGTALGDAIEVQALQKVFGASPRTAPCVLGSVKTNIGHVDSAAGVAGLIKAALCLHHRRLAPTVHFTRPNPTLGLDPNLFVVNAEAMPWQASEAPRRAGVSSFGLGGTNAHAVLEEAPRREDRSAPRAAGPMPPLLLSARDASALRAQAESWASWLGQHPDASLRDVVYTAAVRRAHHLEHRASIAAQTVNEAIEGLRALAESRPCASVTTGAAQASERRSAAQRVTFVFPGQGANWTGMARALLSESPAFVARVEACDAALLPITGWSVGALLRGEDVRDATGRAVPPSRIDVVQPALFTMYVGLAAVYRALGLEPAAVVGHSQGEIAAAVVAGALTLEEGARIVAVRSRVLAETGAGGEMAIVERPVDEVERLIARYHGALSIAAVNNRGSAVISGDAEAIDDLLAELDDQDTFCGRLNAACASHSAHMDPLLPGLAAAFAEIRPRKTTVPFYSTVTGGVLPGEALDATYWCRNLREPVRLDRALAQLVADGERFFVEVSPHPVLAMHITDGTAHEEAVVAGTLERERGGLAELSKTLGVLHVNGYDVDWQKVFGAPGAVVSLPSYRFQRQRYWIEAKRGHADAQSMGLVAGSHPWLAVKTAMPDGSHVFAGRLSFGDEEWAKGSPIFGTSIAPPASMLEIALAVGGLVPFGFIADLAIKQPIVLVPGRPLRLQVSVGPIDDRGRRAFTIHTQAEAALDEEGFVMHAEGELASDGAEPPSPRASAFLEPPDGASWIPAEVVYASLAAREAVYDAGARTLVALANVGDVIFGRAKLDAAAAARSAGLEAHPALLSAIHHAIAFVVAGGGDEIIMPVGWSDVRSYADAAGEIRFRARLAERNGVTEATLLVATPDGVTVLDGTMELAAVSRAELRSADRRVDDHLYRLELVPLAAAPRSSSGAPHARSAVVIGGDGRLGKLLGARTVPDVEALVASLDAGDRAPARILVDASSRVPAGESLAVAAGTTAASGLTLLQRVAADARLDTAELVWVTCGAIAAGPDDPVDDLARSTLWGLVRAARIEQPGRSLRLIDFGVEQVERDPLSAALEVADEPEIAVRQRKVFVPRLGRLPVADPSKPGAPFAIDPDGTVLVTGGIGDLGQALTRHLVTAYGVRRLVLATRRGPSAPGAEAATRELLAAGAESVRVVACDVAKRAEVATLLAAAPAEHPWSAVFHLAGVLDDGLIADQTPERFSRVLAPKLDGAVHLHELTRELRLDAFVLYSSTSGILGGPGQTSYAAANAFLDSLAAHRRARGLPALSMSWGLWDQHGQGLAGHLGERERAELRRQGVLGLTHEEGLASLDRALGSAETHVVPVKLDLPRLQRGADRGTPIPGAFRLLLKSRRRRGDGVRSMDDARGQLALLSDTERRSAVLSIVRAEAEAILATGAEVPVDKPLIQLGLSSLMAVTLRGRLVRRTGVPVRTEEIVRRATCERIAESIVASIVPIAEVTTPASAEPVAAAAATEEQGELVRALAALEGASLAELREAGLLDGLLAFAKQRAAGPPADEPWLQVIKPANQPRGRVFAFPGMGGAASSYAALARHLPDDIELLAIELPGRGARIGERPVARMADLASAVSRAVAGRLDAPSVLLGYSQGAWAAMETAHCLEGISDRRAATGVLVATALPPTAALTAAVEELSNIWDGATISELVPKLAGVLPAVVLENDELMGQFVTACKHDLAIALEYRNAAKGTAPRPLDMPVFAVSATDDPLVPAHAIDTWRDWTRADFAQRSIDGTHAAPLENPEAMSRLLEEVFVSLGRGERPNPMMEQVE